MRERERTKEKEREIEGGERKRGGSCWFDDRVKGRAESRKTSFFSEHHSTFYYVKYEVTINELMVGRYPIGTKIKVVNF
jgi:hypothetical protein